MRLRYILFAALSMVTIIPVIFFGVWPHSRALQNEFENVADRHLLLAQNLSAALERYDRDVKSSFRVLAVNLVHGKTIDGAGELLSNLTFRHLCIARPADGRIVGSLGDDRYPCPTAVPTGRLTLFKDLAQPGGVRFSGVMAGPDGRPTIYLVTKIEGFRAVGAVTTDYFVELGEDIAFGRGGHAAIVDHKGRVLAHPLAEWRETMRDMSDLEPVQRMLKQETGTATFYSPALKEEMIAGFTAVANGWGVMIPQPVAELREKAETVRRSALGVVALGFAAAAAVSWILSGYLTRPVQAVAEAAKKMAGGDRSARVRSIGWHEPRELHEMELSFNAMAAAIDASSQQEAEARKKAEFASRAKTDFLAHMSHELRTPLNAIIGFSELMRGELFGQLGSSKYREYVNAIHQSGSHLLAVINDILDMSKIEAGETDLHDTTFDPAPALERSVEFVKTKADAKQIRLELSLPPVAPWVTADERLFRQIFVNLLSNAVKFTPEGGAVTVSARPLEDGGYEFCVCDTGVGIPEAEIEIVQQPFQQGENPFTRRYRGTGLGLPIVRSLVNLHGGSFALRSSLGKGTEAFVRFPADRVAAARTADVLLPPVESA